MKKNMVGIFGVIATICLMATIIFSPFPAQAEKNSPSSATTFVYATYGDPETLDPALDYETAGEYILQQVYETLLTYNREKTDQYIPSLADTWSISPDGLTYTFHVRPGVQFHDGHILTAEDVAYSFWRGLLQGGSISPQWLLTRPLLGSGIDDISLVVDPSGALYDNRNAMKAAKPAKLLAACDTVQSKVTYDNATGNVVFHLAQAWSPFLDTLTGSWGSIIDKDWVITKGGWSGSCNTWQNYYAMQSNEDPFTTIENGTGPFKLDHWTPGSEIVLMRTPFYWRSSPMWAGGPSGAAALQQVTIQNVADEATRVNMLLDGSADMAIVSNLNYDTLDANVLLRYDAAGLTSTFDHASGTLQAYDDILSTSATDGFFNFNIPASSPYIGTGSWGGGIPVNFFSDIHVRKAFNYAFDWGEYIDQAFGGNAIQRTGPIIKGVVGYTDGQPHYSYDPTLANNEFGQAFGGALTASGFTVTLAYNEGNTVRQKVSEILKAGIEALNPKFHVTVISLPWNDFLTAQNNRTLPLFITGWLQDIPHPDNWVVPYLIGTFAQHQSLPTALTQKYSNKIATCLTKLGDEARVCYEDIQTSTYADVTDIFLAQSISTNYLRAEVRGYYNNPTNYGPYLYALSKGPMPAVSTITPGNATTVAFNDGQGSTGSIDIPAGSVTSDTHVVINPAMLTSGKPSGFLLGNLAFDVHAYKISDDSPVTLTFTTPVQITLTYTGTSRGPLLEDSLRLFYWDGSSWQDAACGAYVRNPDNHMITVPVCHFSKFALGGTTIPVFLPSVFR